MSTLREWSESRLDAIERAPMAFGPPAGFSAAYWSYLEAALFTPDPEAMERAHERIRDAHSAASARHFSNGALALFAHFENDEGDAEWLVEILQEIRAEVLG